MLIAFIVAPWICQLVTCIVLGLVVAFFVVVVPILLLCFSGNLARVEQLRIDAAQANVLNSEAIMGQVTEWNQWIKSRQAYNKIPILCLTVPNGWDDIELIDVGLAGDK